MIVRLVRDSTTSSTVCPSTLTANGTNTLGNGADIVVTATPENGGDAVTIASLTNQPAGPFSVTAAVPPGCYTVETKISITLSSDATSSSTVPQTSLTTTGNNTLGTAANIVVTATPTDGGSPITIGTLTDQPEGPYTVTGSAPSGDYIVNTVMSAVVSSDLTSSACVSPTTLTATGNNLLGFPADIVVTATPTDGGDPMTIATLTKQSVGPFTATAVVPPGEYTVCTDMTATLSNPTDVSVSVPATKLTVSGVKSLGVPADIVAVATPTSGGPPISLGTLCDQPDGLYVFEAVAPPGGYTIEVSMTATLSANAQVSASVPLGVSTFPALPPSATVVTAPSMPSACVGQIGAVAFRPKSAATSSQTVTFAHPFLQGAIPARSGLTIGGVPAQVDAFRLWPDGSVRHGGIAMAVPAMSASQWTVGMMQPATACSTAPVALVAPAATVTIKDHVNQTVLGTVDICAAFGSLPISYLRRGPLVTEGRVRIPLTGVSADFEIVVDLACFGDCTPFRMDVQFCRELATIVLKQNNQPKGADLNYDAAIIVAGSTATYTNITQALYTKWCYTVGESPVHVVFDPNLLYATGAMPYRHDLGVAKATLNLWTPHAFVPLGDRTSHASSANQVWLYMPTTGTRYDIGPTTGPVAAALISQDPTCWTFCLTQAEAASSIPWHYRDKATGRYIWLTDWPTAQPAQTPGEPCNHGNAAGPSLISCGGGWTMDSSHQPDNSFWPWILTGRQKWQDNCEAQAAYCVTSIGQARQGALGYVVPTTTWTGGYGQQVRGQAWALRAIMLADTFLPDSSALRLGTTTTISAITARNFTGLRDYYAWLKPLQGQLAVANPGAIALQNGYWPVALWQQGYLVVILGIADRLGYTGARAAACGMLDLQAGLHLSPDYPPRWALPFEFPIMQSDGKTWITTYKDAAAAVPVWYLGYFGPTAVLNPTQYIGGLDAMADRVAALRMGISMGHAASQSALNWLLANPDTGPTSIVKAAPLSPVLTDAYAQSNPSFVAII